MVPPDSTGISRAPAYSGTSTAPYSRFAYGTLTPSGPPFQARSATLSIAFLEAPQPQAGSTPPGLGSSPFARRYSGNLYLISLPPGTEMFQFPGFASLSG